jgi:hypothetical protein
MTQWADFLTAGPRLAATQPPAVVVPLRVAG